jgi:hypothetical protein
LTSLSDALGSFGLATIAYVVTVYPALSQSLQ